MVLASPIGIYPEAVGEWEGREDQSLSSGGGGLLETLRDPLFPPSPYEQASLASLDLSAALLLPSQATQVPGLVQQQSYFI